VTQLDEVFDLDLFDRMVNERFVRVQYHPTEPLAIANYTETAVFDKAWNGVTLQCRGLIYNTATLEVVARPFRKFFNHSEGAAPAIGLNAPVTVTDKKDGSLGVLYRMPVSGKWAVATRGSFTSEQAARATVLYLMNYEARFEPRPSLTYLFEIIYPQNRIVVDYGRMADLILLGAVDIRTGKSISPGVIQDEQMLGRRWPGPVTETFSYRTYGEALAAAPRPGMEGLVVHDLLTDERVKIKQEDYVTLHRLVTGLTSRRVHEAMLAGIDLDEFIAPLPDEFHDWVRGVAADIDFVVREANRAINRQWHRVVATCEEQSAEGEWPASVSMGMDTGSALTREQRKLFASIAQSETYAWALFARLDGRDYQEKLLNQAEPEIETPQGRTFTEATA